MRRHVFALFCCGLFFAPAVFAKPAQAGERHVWYSARCCYVKIERHETRSRYVRVDPGYDRYSGTYRYGRPSDRFYSLYADPWDVAPPRRFYRRYRYSRYGGGYTSDLCYWRRGRAGLNRVGQVWRAERVCY